MGLNMNGKLIDALTASPKSPSFMINCFLLYTSEAIQRKGTKSLSKSPLHAAVARAYRSTKTRFIWIGFTTLVGRNWGFKLFRESLKEKRILKNSGVGRFFLKWYTYFSSTSPEYHLLKSSDFKRSTMSSGEYPIAYREPIMAPMEVPAI